MYRWRRDEFFGFSGTWDKFGLLVAGYLVGKAAIRWITHILGSYICAILEQSNEKDRARPDLLFLRQQIVLAYNCIVTP
jgi:hypothetical protein